jgi:predicted phosphodiesterase
MKNGSKIVCLGDIHFPYHNQEYLNKFYEAVKQHKPQVICQIGDLYDQYCFSRYSKSADFTTPEEELTEGRKQAERMWNKLHLLAPNARLLQLKGNHDQRIAKRVAEKLPELEGLLSKGLNDLYKFKGVHTVPDERTETIIDGLVFIHGYLSKLGDHTKKNLMSTVVGHSHVGGAVFFNHRDETLFELNVGYVADKNALPLQYGGQRMKQWTPGMGLLTKIDGIWQPQFISFQ